MKHNDVLPQLLCEFVEKNHELMFLGTIKLNIVGSKNVSNFLGCVISSYKFHADIQTGSVVQLRNDLMIHALLVFRVSVKSSLVSFSPSMGALDFLAMQSHIYSLQPWMHQKWRDPFKFHSIHKKLGSCISMNS